VNFDRVNVVNFPKLESNFKSDPYSFIVTNYNLEGDLECSLNSVNVSDKSVSFVKRFESIKDAES